MDIPIKCVECGNFLDGNLNQKGELEVDLCTHCIEGISDDEYSKGYDAGYDKGYSKAE